MLFLNLTFILSCIRNSFLILSYPYMLEKVLLFLSQIFDAKFMMDWHTLRFPESENYNFNGSSVCMCVYVCVFVSVISVSQKTNYSRNFKFGILHSICMLLEIFTKNGQKLCAQEYTDDFLHITAYDQNFLLVHCRIFRLH